MHWKVRMRMLHSYDVALVAKMDAFSDMTEPFQIFSTPS